MVDDSLLLGWDRDSGKPKGPGSSALSATTCRRVFEDPHKHYLLKVEGLDQPYSLPFALGGAVHHGFEMFFEGAPIDVALEEFGLKLEDEWDQIDGTPTRRVNLEDPSNPRDKENVEISLDEARSKSRETLGLALRLIEAAGQYPYSILKAQNQTGLRPEVSIGKLAEENGRPTTTAELWNHPEKAYTDQTVPVVAGAPFRGEADLVGPWPGGGQFILDHKFVSKVVSYYPRWHGDGRKSYGPSYDPATSRQLDIYSVAAGIPRSGFQFLMKLPQYIPDDGVLHDWWFEEPQWRNLDDPKASLPMAWANNRNGELRYVSVWRSQPEDHSARPPHYHLPSIETRTKRYAREAAEYLTESFLLLQNGVAPEIAFPAGDPEEIGKKACPFCAFGPNADGENANACANPRMVENSKQEARSKDSYAYQIRQREKLCEETPEIQERREHWEANWHGFETQP